MAIFGWPNLDPLAGVRQLSRELERFFGRSAEDARQVGGGMYPPLNVLNGPDDIVVQCEAPGIAAGDIDLSITGDTLVLKGTKRPPEGEEKLSYQRRERGVGDFTRTVVLPDRVDPDRVEAKLADGLLTVTLAKSESAKPKKIKIQ